MLGAFALLALAFDPFTGSVAHAAVPRIAAGFDRSCAVGSNGAALCWGDNATGALGRSTAILALGPIQVTGLASGVAAVVSGSAAYHTCAITTAGAAYCWGNGNSGELGNGTIAASTVPVPVTGLGSGVASMALGNIHTCAVTTAGAAYCWGSNEFGQLGNGDLYNRHVPTAVTGFTSGVKAMTAGIGHTCALTTSGAVLCWGSNEFGQLGNGTTTDSTTPTPVTGLSSGVVAIAAGFYHTCALTNAGAVVCWGINSLGQIGDGTTSNRSVPVSVVGLGNGVASIAMGGYHGCAVTVGGGVVCWGLNTSGQLGNGSTTNSPVPVAVVGLSAGVTSLAGGWTHTCAVMTNGSSMCWGYNGLGQFADGTKTASSTPVPSSRLTVPIVSITAGEIHTCALTTTGAALCWGGNGDFELGDGQPVGFSSPLTVTGMGSGIAAIATGFSHACALSSAGAVSCWGSDTMGQLGNGYFSASSSYPVATSITSGAIAIATGADHSCALTSAGAALCWGMNDNGQVGDGTTIRRASPVAVTGLASPLTAIAGGHRHTCGLDSSGRVLCWGRNAEGQLGNGTTTDSSVPVPVPGISGATAIAVGGWHDCVITASGGVACWGDNASGQLGNGSTQASSPTPVNVSGLSSGVASIAAGDYHTCALTTAGGVLCWGWNGYGELGDGSTQASSVPVPVQGLSSGVAALALGRYHTCALMVQGNVVCWGYNSAGGLGDATFAGRAKSVVTVNANASGSLATNDWFLDLDPALPKAIPPDKVPGYLVDTTGNAATALVDVTASVQFRPQDVGNPIYIFGYVPASLVKRADGGAKDGGCVLAQLSPSGIPVQASASGLQSYVASVSGSQQQAVGVLNGVIAANIAGGTFCVGTASTSAQSVDPSNSRCVATVPPVGTSDPVCLPPSSIAANLPGPLTGLWWNANEPGWGIHFTERRNIVFAAWYTYDGSGNPKWYVASNCTLPAGTTGATGTCSGTLYEVSGSTFFGTPFNSGALSIVSAGTLQVSFQDASHASMAYDANGQARTVAITRQVFRTGTTPPAVDYTDLWWNPNEPGWGLAIAQQYDVMFLAWYVYDGTGKPMWYVASSCNVSGNGCSGTLYRTTGPAFGPTFDTSLVKVIPAGTVSVNFTDPNNGTLSYTVNGVTSSKAITRQLF